MRFLVDIQAAQVEPPSATGHNPVVELALQLLRQGQEHEWLLLLHTAPASGNSVRLKSMLDSLETPPAICLFATAQGDPSEGRSLSALLYADFIRRQHPDALIRLMPTDTCLCWPQGLHAAFPIAVLNSAQDIPDTLEQLCKAPAPVIANEDADQSVMARLANQARPHASDGDLMRRIATALAYNRPPPQRQLLLDVSVLAYTDAKSGIQRVVRSIFIELMLNPPAHRTVRAIRFRDGGYHYADNFSAQATGVPGSFDEAPIDLHQGDTYLALDLNMNTAQQTTALHKDMLSKGVDMFYIVYDLLPVIHPEWWHDDIAPMYREWLKSISQTATGLCCISAAVAGDLTQWLSENPPQRDAPGPAVCSFHLGADVQNSLPTLGLPESADKILAELQNSHTFLMVSTLEPRKGHAQTLEAFDLLWQQGLDIRLVIVGRRGWLVDRLLQRIISHPENGKRLFWLEGISDEYLERVYAASTCLIAASEGEGFGLPLIEAAQHRLPILARSLPVFQEVAGEHACYFEGLAPQAIAEAVQAWLALYLDHLHPPSTDLPWLNWKQSVQQLLAAMQRCTAPLQHRAPPQLEKG